MWQQLFSQAILGIRRAKQLRKTSSARLAKLANFEALERREMLTATPSGSEFLVSQEFQGTQRIVPEVSSVAVSDTGQSIVVYHGRGAAGSRVAGDDREIFVQRYDEDGVAEGEAFVANSVTRGDQLDPSTDAAGDGTFWVTWSGRGLGDRYGVYAQRFAADGTTIGDVLLVNSTVGGAQTRPDIAAADDGSAVVVWSGVGVEDGNNDFDGVFMRRIDTAGNLAGEEVRVNTATIGQQDYAKTAISESGEFVVTWSSREGDNDDWGVFAQQYNADGTTKGIEIEVNATTAASQFASDVGIASDGSFVVTWSSFNQDGDSWGVFAQQFSSAGATVGSEFQVSDSTAGHQQDAAIAVADAGEFVIAWSNGVEGGDGWETQVRSFDPDGAAEETPITVNQTTGQDSGHQRTPAVDINQLGNSLVVFHGNSSTDHQGVFGQLYEVDVTPAENLQPNIDSINGEDVFTDLRFPGAVGQELRIRVEASDDNRSDTLTYSLDPNQSPDDAVFERIDNNTAEIVWTPSIEDLDNGGVEFRILVTDDGEGLLQRAQGFVVDVQNQAPVIDLNGTLGGTGFEANLSMTETVVAAVDSANLTIADAEQTNLESATALIRSVSDRAVESLEIDTTGTNITANYDIQTSTLTLSGTDTIANYQTALRTLEYQNLATDRTVGGTRQIDITVTDGGVDGVSNLATAIINIEGINAAPEFAEIQDVTLLSGSPLHIPLVASDADGNPISFTASSDNASVSTFLTEGNRSARVNVSSADPSFIGGELVFELFEQRAPRATERIVELANDGFYDGIIFHRVINGFVIQGGDPTGTGTGGSTLGDFDDQFHPDLQHNRSGLLSMAKSSDDTNDSQFFVTEGPTRNLDSQHTIFGILVTGEEVREEISNVDTDAADRPLNDVVIDSFEIFVDDENGVLMLSAPEGVTGSAVITVTASDGMGGTTTQTFNVTVQADAFDNPPYLEDVAPQTMSTNSTHTFQLSAIDVDSDNDEFTFIDQDQLQSNTFVPTQTENLRFPENPVSSDDLLVTVAPDTGIVTVVASNGVTGDHQIVVGVVATDNLFAGFGRAVDLQVVDITIN